MLMLKKLWAWFKDKVLGIDPPKDPDDGPRPVK